MGTQLFCELAPDSLKVQRILETRAGLMERKVKTGSGWVIPLTEFFLSFIDLAFLEMVFFF
jgi:hypothetical protein